MCTRQMETLPTTDCKVSTVKYAEFLSADTPPEDISGMYTAR